MSVRVCGRRAEGRETMTVLRFVVAFTLLASAQDFLTNDSVVKLVKAGLPDEIILNMVRTQPARFETGADHLLALKNANVSEKVISAMLLRNSGTAAPADGASRIIKIPNRTPVKLSMLETLSSGTARAGEAVKFSVNEDILVNGKVVIAKAATASGRVTDVRPKNLTSRNGLLEITIDSAKSVDGQDVPLRGTLKKDLGGTGFGRMGKNVEFEHGTLIDAVVDGDKEIKLTDEK
jgi:hypothetical protein